MSLIDLIRKGGSAPKCSAVIVAAGSSVRMGYDKLTAQLGASPVLLRTLRAFDASEHVAEIVIVTRMDRVAEIADLCAQNGIAKVSKVVAGGRTRMESSLIGVSAVKSNARLIAIHDAARPLVSSALIKRVVCAADEHKAAVPVVPSTDTLKAVGEDDFILGTVDRESTYRVQTPQVFDAVLIKGALTRAAESGLALSDDSAAMEMTGFRTYAVAGEEDNIKITRPRDLLIAEAILKDRGEL